MTQNPDNFSITGPNRTTIDLSPSTVYISGGRYYSHPFVPSSSSFGVSSVDCSIPVSNDGTSNLRNSYRRFRQTVVDERTTMGKATSYDVSFNNGNVIVSDKMTGKDASRGQWGSQMEFMLACIGYAVGLGNVWRFPYLAYENGGATFLIPYFISLFIAGLPIFYLELILGQFSSLGPNQVFAKLAPVFRGIGWVMITIAFLVSIYYNMIIAWVLLYFFYSLRLEVPWATCRNDWNTYLCQSNLESKWCEDTTPGTLFFNKTCHAPDDVLQTLIKNMSAVSPSEEFYNNKILGLSPGFEQMGGIQWELVASLFVAWVIIFLCIFKGVQSTGKVVYFTATFPYVVLVILLIRGVTLEGASNGLVFYLKPDFSKLLEVKVWRSAATQIFYSLGPGFGSLLTMASYNRFKNNCYRDALIVAFTNCGTSLFAGVAIFSTMGFMAHDLGITDVGKVVKSGPGLAFIAYPEAIVRMPWPPLMAVLFFFMLFTLGLDSQFAMVETVTTAIMDEWTWLRRYKTPIIAATCAAMFVCGLPMCFHGGLYVFELFNTYSAGYSLMLVALCEFLVVAFVYGIGNISRDIRMMLGDRRSGPVGQLAEIIGPTGFYFKGSWLVGGPIFMMVILILSFVFYLPTKVGDYEFPWWADGLGWLMSTLPLFWIPLFAAYEAYKCYAQRKPFMSLLRASSEWCPADERSEKQAVNTTVRMSQISVVPVTTPSGTIETVVLPYELVETESVASAPPSYSNNAYQPPPK